jgi:hypothetical protein
MTRRSSKMDEKKIASKLANSVIAESTAYQEFFQKKLKKYNVKSPSELKGDEKKKFFDEIDSEWKADKEED